MEYQEAHVERLLGRQVRDIDGRVVGRLEELHVEMIDGEFVVTEYHVGAAALLERVGRFITQLPFFRYIPFARKGYRVPWTQFNLSDPRHLRVTTRRGDLTPIKLSD